MQQDNIQEQPIKTLDWLQNTHQKLTPQILEELKELLKQKYGIDMSKEIFHITREELDALKAELDGNVSPKTTLEKFLYDEYIETKLEKDGKKAVSIESVTSWIESARLSEMKTKFEQALDPILSSYEFLNEGSKNIIKLALANKFIASAWGNDVMSMIWDLKWGFENMSLDSLTNLADNASKKEKSKDSVESQFQEILKPYIKWFNSITKKLDAVSPKLTKEQKQNIVNACAYFRNPSKVEAGWDEKILAEIDVNNKDTAETPLSIEEQKNMKEYLLSSRTKIEAIASQFEGWEKVLEMWLGMMAKEWFIWDTTKSLVELLLKIPILGQILAMFLWLDGNNPIWDLNEQVDNYKLLDSFKKLGVEKDAQWKITQKWFWECKEMDLSGISYSHVKGELKSLAKIKGSTSNDDFWKWAFQKDGYEIDGVWFKLNLTDDMKKDGKLSNKEFSELLKTGMENFQNEKAKKSTESEQKARSEKQQKDTQKVAEIQWNIQSIDGKINTIDEILSKKYEKIVNFTTLIWAAISDVEISKIRNNSNDSFETIIKDTIWELKYKALLEKDPQTLNNLFAFIKQYAIEKNIETGNVKDFLKNYNNDFQAFVTNKKTVLIAEKEKTTGTLTQAQKETNEAKKVLVVQERLKQANGKNINEIAGFKLDSEKWEIQIEENKYKVSGLLPGAKIEDITIWEKEVTFKWTLWPIPKLVPIAKQEFIFWIATLMETGKFQNDKITLTKIA